jgi:hypothetical protein
MIRSSLYAILRRTQMECLASILIIGIFYGVLSFLVKFDIIDPDAL